MVFVLTLALGVAPTLPAFATAQTDRTAPEAHVVHAGFDDVNVSCAGHAMNPDGVDAHRETSCAQCFTAIPTVSMPFSVVLAVYTPIEPRLYDRLVVAPQDRPPAA